MACGTRTYVLMPVSQATFDEIYEKFKAVGQDPLVPRRDQEQHMDMQGIALVVEDQDPSPEKQTP